MPRKISDGNPVPASAVLASAASGSNNAAGSSAAQTYCAPLSEQAAQEKPDTASAFLPVSAPPRTPARTPAPPAKRASDRESRGLQKAEDLATKGSIDKALLRLQKLIADVPTSSRAYLKAASLLRENKTPADALPLLLSLVERAPHLIYLREVLAELYLEAGRWDDALLHGHILLKAAPRSLLARELLSAAYLQKGQFDRALTLTAEMIRLDPRDPSHHFKRGVLLQQKGEIGAAVVAFGRVLTMGGGDIDAADEARAALEMLDNHQIRQIITLAIEDMGFRLRLRQSPEETLASKGFILSQTGLFALCQMRFDDLPAPPPGWRHLRYH